MFALSAMSYFDRTVLSIAGPGIMKEFHISETQMGSVFSAFLLTYTLMMTPGGALADRFGGRLVLSISGLGAALFTGLTSICGPAGLGGLLGVVPAFVVMRLAFGICASPIYPSTSRIAAAWIPPSQQARVQAIIMGAAAVGAAVAPMLFSHLIGAYGWRVSFWFAAAATAVLIAIWYLTVQDHPPGRAHTAAAQRVGEKGAWRRLLADRNLLLLTGSYFALNYFEYIFFFWLYYYFGQIRKMGMDQSAFYTTLMWIAWVVMTPIGGWVSDRLITRFGMRNGRRIVPMVGLTVSAILVYIGCNVTGTVATVTLLCLSLGFAASTDGPYWAAAIDAGGRHSGTGCAIVNTGGNLGGMLAPVVTPLIASWAGWSAGIYAGGALALLGVAVWFFIGVKPSAHATVTAAPEPVS